MASETPENIDRQFCLYIETKYGIAAVNDREKLIEAVINLLGHGREQGLSPHMFLDRVSQVISRLYAFEEIVIGLYDRKENDYCNEIVLGYKDDIANGLRRLRYSNEDIANQERLPHVKTGKLSEFNRLGGPPKPEQKSPDGLSAVSVVKKSLDEFNRGDSIRIWMRDPRVGLVGWIMVSRPRDSRLPPKISVLWLELIASISACVITRLWHQEDLAGGS